MSEQFNKIFMLDTNIILNNAQNFITMSDHGNNLIILPETVLDEIDKFKTGFEEINFQSREFARMLYDAKIIDIQKDNGTTIVVTHVGDCVLYMVSKEEYKIERSNISPKILNDRKILEVAEDLYKKYKKMIFVSLDIMARTRAISLGIQSEPLMLTSDVDYDIDFHTEIEIFDYNGETKRIPIQESHISSIEVINEAGKHFIYYKGQTDWELISETNDKRIPLPPINKRQKIMSELILSRNDIIVCTGKAGTGKTAMALASAMRLIDTNKQYNKIYYIRRSVISGTKEDELGFLPGDLSEKMAGYNTPMEDSIKKLAKTRKKNQTKEEIEERMYDIKDKYQIEYLYAGHLRGSNLDEGSILIVDEIQNFDINSIKTIFSRVSKDSIILSLGSNNQIDSQYLTKNTNALTFLMNLCGHQNEFNVKINGVKLTNVMRSDIADWADNYLIR